MKNSAFLNYYDKIKALLPPDKFGTVKEKIEGEKNERLEAFWYIIVAGYPVDFALEHYKRLYDYLKDKPVGYSEALATYSIYPSLNSAIYVSKTRWYELN